MIAAKRASGTSSGSVRRSSDENSSRITDVGTVDSSAISYDACASTATEAHILDHLHHFVVALCEGLSQRVCYELSVRIL